MKQQNYQGRRKHTQILPTAAYFTNTTPCHFLHFSDERSEFPELFPLPTYCHWSFARVLPGALCSLATVERLESLFLGNAICDVVRLKFIVYRHFLVSQKQREFMCSTHTWHSFKNNISNSYSIFASMYCYVCLTTGRLATVQQRSKRLYVSKTVSLFDN